MTRPRFATHVNLSCGRVSYMETRRITPPPVMVLRKIRDAVDMPNRILTEVLRRTHAQYYETEPVDSLDKILFWKLIGTPAGSQAERDLRNQLFDRHKRIAEKVARRWSRNPERREELAQRCNETMLFAILNHVPTRSFARYAYASCRGTMLQAYFEEKYPNLDRQTRYHVVRIDAYIRRRGNNTRAASCAEISDALKIPLSKVENLVRVANIRTVSLDLPIGDEPGSYRQVAEPTPAGFADIELSASITAALADLPSPETALKVIMLHLVEGMPLPQVAARVHLTAAEATSLVASATSRLKSALASSELRP
ncbi:sigma-70 family RNA polymerase sigma factor [Nocardia terpenica]|uniref:sigma-70 family RNA polymerase sigma factor n=1 Tax=Nocardia terpenica TaxID=455432 RepID=UPI002FE05F20